MNPFKEKNIVITEKIDGENNMVYIIVEDNGARNCCGATSMSFAKSITPQKNIYKIPEIDNTAFKDFLKILSKSRKEPRVIFSYFEEDINDFSKLSKEDFMSKIYAEK